MAGADTVQSTFDLNYEEFGNKGNTYKQHEMTEFLDRVKALAWAVGLNEALTNPPQLEYGSKGPVLNWSVATESVLGFTEGPFSEAGNKTGYLGRVGKSVFYTSPYLVK